jgi:hypothetical protein
MPPAVCLLRRLFTLNESARWLWRKYMGLAQEADVTAFIRAVSLHLQALRDEMGGSEDSALSEDDLQALQLAVDTNGDGKVGRRGAT